jgi:hypothetical protein
MTELQELCLPMNKNVNVPLIDVRSDMFARLGMWSGRNIKIYDNYFKDCAIRGEKLRLVSMIHEEICDLALQARGV